jgi:hypothetical protein
MAPFENIDKSDFGHLRLIHCILNLTKLNNSRLISPTSFFFSQRRGRAYKRKSKQTQQHRVRVRWYDFPLQRWCWQLVEML